MPFVRLASLNIQSKNPHWFACLLTASLLILVSARPAFADPDFTQNVSRALWTELDSAGNVCNLSLGGKSPVYLEAEVAISKAISSRVADLRDDYPVLNDGAGKQTHITKTLILQFGSNVMTDIRVRLFEVGNKILDRWKTQFRVQADLVSKPRVVQAQALLNRQQIDFNAYTVFPNPFLDGAPVFPGIDQLSRDPSLLQRFSGSPARDGKKASGLRGRITEYQARNQPLKLNETYDLDLSIQQELILIQFRPYLERLKTLGMKVANEFGEIAAAAAVKRASTNIKNEIATWHAYLSLDPYLVAKEWFDQSPLIMQEMLAELRKLYPIGDAEFSDPVLPSLIAQIESLEQQGPEGQVRELVSNNGLTLDVKSSKIYAWFDKSLGASFLATRPNPYAANPHKPVFALWHGDGTTRSNMASWRSLLPFYEANGFNAVAESMPIAGGPALTKVKETISFLNRSNNEIRRQIGDEQPLIVGGRSMGSSKGLLHAMLFGGNKDPVDAYFLISYSNPQTMDFQTASVYEQVKAGLFSGLIKESLDSAGNISLETLRMLRDAKAKNPTAFASFGNNVLFFQGDADADGGPTVMADLKNFVNEFAPLAHIREFHMPAAQREAYDKILRGEEVWFEDFTGNRIRVEEDMLEGQHFIHSNRDDNPIGAPKTQSIQALADIYRFMDYLADGPGEGLVWPTERERLSQARFKTSREKSGAGDSFFKWYIRDLKSRKVNVDESAVANFRNPKSNTRDVSERLAYVDQYWAKEKARVVAVYKKLGMLQ